MELLHFRMYHVYFYKQPDTSFALRPSVSFGKN